MCVSMLIIGYLRQICEAILSDNNKCCFRTSVVNVVQKVCHN